MALIGSDGKPLDQSQSPLIIPDQPALDTGGLEIVKTTLEDVDGNPLGEKPSGLILPGTTGKWGGDSSFIRIPTTDEVKKLTGRE